MSGSVCRAEYEGVCFQVFACLAWFVAVFSGVSE